MLSSLSLNPKLWCTLCALAVAMVVAAPLRAQDAATEDSAADAPVAEVVAEEVVEEEAPPTVESLSAALASVHADTNTLWTCLAAFLVFFMQAGFALVECGFTRAKNACNIIMKNLMDFSVGSLAFWAVGFGLMFGVTNGFCGTNFFLFDGDTAGSMGGNPDVGFSWAFLIFQTVFAATAATIVSGAMAERTKFVSYLCYSVLITLIVYPIFGSWAWGNLYLGAENMGWLGEKGFIDFAGSTVVHSVGGWAALAGAIVIGPRIGKYTADGKIKPIPGHNIPLAALGVFILWLGWFGFNPGSTTMIDSGEFAKVAVVTNLSAAAGAIGALAISWIMFRKPDTSFALNGALAGLVAITAGCYNMNAGYSILTGLIAGVVVVFSCVLIDKIKIDDPVGAVSVHGVCGAFGTLAVGLWGIDHTSGEAIGIVNGGGVAQLITQFIGVAAGFGWAFGTSLIIFLLLKFTIGLRVPAEEEIKGLDIVEHGMYAYPPHLVSESLGGSTGGSPTGSGSTSPGVVTHGA